MALDNELKVKKLERASNQEIKKLLERQGYLLIFVMQNNMKQKMTTLPDSINIKRMILLLCYIPTLTFFRLLSFEF
jgi:hypothetical protein